MRSILLMLSVLAWGMRPALAKAQAVQGQVVERGTATPIRGAFIVLLDRDGRQRGAVLSDSTGHFYLRVRDAGYYTLRVERIGHRTTTTPTLTLAAGSVISQRVEVPIEPIPIEGLHAARSARCRIPREAGAATQHLWDEARKALAVTAWGERQSGVPYQKLLYERTRNLLTLEIERQKARLQSGFGRRAFTSIDTRDLATNGYVRRLPGDVFQYFAPDAATLLSDPFLETHCFRVRRPPRGQENLIGLGFEPLRTHAQADVEGVLWLDRGSLELRFLEFHFTQLLQPIDVPPESFGGRVDFRHLANGAWVVDRWWLRMPQLPPGPTSALSNTEPRPTDTDRDRLIQAQRLGLGIREEGGELRYIAGPGSPARGSATLEGAVYDSIRGRPLVGAIVFLASGRPATVTDNAGRFHLTDLPAGRQYVGFLHPFADSLGLPVRPHPVLLSPGERAKVSLFIPRGRGCPISAGPARAAVMGVVYDRHSGAPVAHAAVTARWRSRNTSDRGFHGPIREVTVQAEGNGRFLLCGLPAGVDVRLTARNESHEAEVDIRAAAGAILQRDLVIH